METYPSTPTGSYPLKLKAQWNTRVSDFESGTEQRVKVWATPKRNISITYDILSDTEIATIWDFYTARQGSFEAFWFFHPNSRAWKSEYIDRGDGSTTLFDLPCKNTDSGALVVYINSVVTPATFTSGGGGGGADRIQFDATGSVSSSSVANPTTITTTAAHGLTTGNIVTISGHSGSTPDINNSYTVTVLTTTTFTIPVNVTVGGTGGTWTLDAPISGVLISADVTGELRLKTRFAQEDLEESMLEYLFYSIGLQLKEVRT